MNEDQICKKIRAYLRENGNITDVRDDTKLTKVLSKRQISLLPSFCQYEFGIDEMKKVPDTVTLRELVGLIDKKLSCTNKVSV